MKSISKCALLSVLALIFLAVGAFSQVRLELTGFGLYNLNLGFPSKSTISSSFLSNVSMYYDPWQPFFKTAVLEQQGGFGFGGRVAVELTPMIALEGSVEYDLVKRRFNAAAVADLKAMIDDLHYTPYFTSVDSIGKMLKFYGNVNVSLMTQGLVVPYLTAGLGLTLFKDEPSIAIDRPDIDEHLNLYYDSGISALTFNFGAGLKYFFRPNIGLRLDARVFFCGPKFQQTFGYNIGTKIYYSTGDSVLQDGSHMDLSLNAGFVARF